MKINSILIVKPGAIGDLLQLTPVVRALNLKFPVARISVIVGNSASVDIFRYNPSIHEIIVFDRRGEHRPLPAFVKLWQRLHGAHYDLVVNYQRSNLKTWLLVTAALPAHILVYHKERKKVIHAVQNHLETVLPLGIDPEAADNSLELVVGPEDEAYADTLLGLPGCAGKRIVALNPGASHPVNRWSPESFARLADHLTAECRVKVIIVGGDGDMALAEEITRLAASDPINLAGTTTLLQLGAVLKRCSLLVSGDTGPMHMATAVGTRVVALFGAADPARTGPVGAGHRVIQAGGVECVPCRSRRCANGSNLECMEKITVEEVFGAVASMLGDAEE